MTPAEAKAKRGGESKSREVVRSQVQESREEDVKVPILRKKTNQKASARAALMESKQDEAEDAKRPQEPEASKRTIRKTPKRKFDIFKPPREDESDEELVSSKKKPKLKKIETAPTRRSNRGKDIYEPHDEEEDEDTDNEAADSKPSSSRKGGSSKKKEPVVTTASKKAKTKK